MTERSLDQLRADVTTLQHVVGGPLPFGRGDVWLSILLLPAGAVLAIGAPLVPWNHVLWLLIPLGLVMCGHLMLRWRFRRPTGRSPLRRREYTLALIMLAIFLPATLAFLWLWAPRIGLANEAAGSAALIFVGLMTLSWTIMDARRLSSLGAAVPLIVLGILVPLTEPLTFVVCIGVALMFAGAAMAAIMHHQLRRQGLA